MLEDLRRNGDWTSRVCAVVRKRLALGGSKDCTGDKMTAPSLEHVHAIARGAEHRADVAANHALRAHEHVGAMARELAALRELVMRGQNNLAGKVDACRDDVRTLAREVRKLRSVEDAMRKKLASFSDLDAVALEGLTERELRWMRIKSSALRTGKRAVQAAVVAAVGLVAMAVTVWLLHRMGLHVPRELVGE